MEEKVWGISHLFTNTQPGVFHIYLPTHNLGGGRKSLAYFTFIYQHTTWGISHLFTNTQSWGISHLFTNTQSTQPRGWGRRRRTNKNEFVLAPSARRSLRPFCAALRAFAGYCDTPTSHKECWLIFLRWSTRHPVVQQVLTAAYLTSVDCSPLCPTLISWLTFSWLLSPADYSLLLPSADCFSGILLPSSSSGIVGDLTHKPFVWVSRQNRQRDRLAGTHTMNA